MIHNIVMLSLMPVSSKKLDITTNSIMILRIRILRIMILS
jgi:hypothetical protein